MGAMAMLPLRDAVAKACTVFSLDPLSVDALDANMSTLRLHKSPRRLALKPYDIITLVPSDDEGCVDGASASSSSMITGLPLVRLNRRTHHPARSDPFLMPD